MCWRGCFQNQNQNLYSIAVSADDPTTDILDGFTSGNEISFRIWRAADNREATVSAVQFYPGYTNKYESMGTTVAGIDIPVTGTPGQVTVLGDSYPNPFMLETTIPFTMSEESNVELAIYDVLGRKVTTLVNAKLRPGSHMITWDGSNSHQEKVNPGVYLCRMSTRDMEFVKRIEVGNH